MSKTTALLVATAIIGTTQLDAAGGQSGRGYPIAAPFSAVRWKDSTPEVKVKDQWYELLAINSASAKDIVAFCKEKENKQWKKRFEEDLVEMMDRMGHKPGTKVALKLRDLATDKEVIMKDVAMTEENREAIRKSAERERR
jgi:hypothetical protein